MKRWIALAGLALAAAGCADAAAPVSPDVAAPVSPDSAGARFALTGLDQDGDGIDDGLESDLANTYAPVLYMPNLVQPTSGGGDWTWPATVDWYLDNTALRFHHDNCPDHEILAQGSVNATNLVTQRHQRASSWVGCSHSGDWYSSGGGAYSTDNRFFLEPQNPDAVRPGLRDPSLWKTYYHVYRNSIGGYNVQYWIFYAYNDWHIGNHEGDWEHVNVRLNASHGVEGVWLSRHGGLHWYPANQVFGYGGTHPEVWVADGSHAMFIWEGECDNDLQEGTASNCWTNNAQRWFTWGGGPWYEQGIYGAGLVNMGELPKTYTNRRPMPGQDWMRFRGMWGELGTGWTGGKTNGPPSPAYQSSWLHDAATTTGTAGSGECTGTGGTSPTQIRPDAC